MPYLPGPNQASTKSRVTRNSKLLSFTAFQGEDPIWEAGLLWHMRYRVAAYVIPAAFAWALRLSAPMECQGINREVQEVVAATETINSPKEGSFACYGFRDGQCETLSTAGSQALRF